ncbi:MAG: YkgJ family cysteine cluster protein [Bacillota bacterium]
MEAILSKLFADYEELASLADQAFERMRRGYGDLIKCQLHCTDCCYAVFGLFPVEAVYLRHQFDKLDQAVREEILRRAEQADGDLQRLQEKLARFADDSQMQAYVMARERVRCPLLNEQDECALYSFRPITCRVYGIPVAVRGKGQVCWKAGFERGDSYPTFDLDAVYKDLYRLSQELLNEGGATDMEKAGLLLSVSKVLRTPLEDLMQGELG